MTGIRCAMRETSSPHRRLDDIARCLAIARHPDTVARLVREYLREVAR